jgi:DNA-binding NtrC family response regulator
VFEKEPFSIFVVEDDPTYRKYLSYVLGLNPDYDTRFFATGEELLDHLHEKPALVTLDYRLPDMSGQKVLEEIKARAPEVDVIVVSGQDDIETAVQLLKAGAYDYITKEPEARDRLLNSIQNARNKVSLIREISRLQKEIEVKYEFGKSIIGNSPALRKVFSLIEKALLTNIVVSITGETGTGKDLVAKAIHFHSKRKNKPFVAVNVAAIPRELLESELFGHEKGAFTGAVGRRIGKFEEAEGGTLFLDEIADLDPALQAKLLRVLQEKEITRIGSNKPVSLDVRIVVATHRNLADEVKKGRFREDLYYRLLGLTIELPPLRDRGSDILLLARHFLDLFSAENSLKKVKLSAEAQDKLLQYAYPGNVRELKSILDLAAVMCEGGEIQASDITFKSATDEESLFHQEMTLEQYTYKIVRHFMTRHNNNVLEVARRLQVGKSTLYRYLKEMEAKGI